MTQRARFCAPNVNTVYDILYQPIKIKSSGKKVFDLNINFLCPREQSLQFFFLKFVFSKLFIAIVNLKMYNFLYGNSNGVQTKIFYLFTFVKILNHSPAQDLSNKKNRSSLRLLWAQIFLRQFIKFWHKRAIRYFVHPLYVCVWVLIASLHKPATHEKE